LRIRIAEIEDAIKVGEPEPWLLRELREHEKQLREELNDFTPNLKAIERTRDLLELAEGRKQDADQAQYRQQFTGMDELLSYYREITIGRRSLP
jgi:hypothetical protein